MSTTYRCKVRKPDGSAVDGCGFQLTPPKIKGDDEHFSRDGMKCPECPTGVMRAVALAAQIHGGPLVARAIAYEQARPLAETTLEPIPPHHGDARGRLLRAEVLPRVKALALAATTYPDAHVDCASVRECIALLQSLLPVNPEADRQAQTDMATEHNARASVEEVAARLTGEYLRGGWSVPSNTLNAFFRQAYAHGRARK